MTLTDEAAEYAAEFHGAPAAVQGLMKRAFMFGALSALTSKPPSAALCRLRKAEEA